MGSFGEPTRRQRGKWRKWKSTGTKTRGMVESGVVEACIDTGSASASGDGKSGSNGDPEGGWAYSWPRRWFLAGSLDMVRSLTRLMTYQRTCYLALLPDCWELASMCLSPSTKLPPCSCIRPHGGTKQIQS